MFGSKTNGFSERFQKNGILRSGILINHRNPNKNQVRESPAALNIPTPTPAPDRGGPAACPVAKDQPENPTLAHLAQ